MNEDSNSHREHSFLSITGTFILVILLVVLLKVLVFGLFSIPSASMEDTVLPGDRVVVSKLHYGPRLPQSPFEVSWVNVLFWLNKKARSHIDSTWWKYKRLRGFSQVAQGDVVVFNFPGKNRGTFYIKRCTGLPGDTLVIKHGTIICNGQAMDPPELYKANYFIRTTDMDRMFRFTDSQHISVSKAVGDEPPACFQAVLNLSEYRHLKELRGIESVSYAAVPAERSSAVYPYNQKFLWSPDNFGPVAVPKKGMQIELNERNFIIYGSTINNYEGQTISFENGQSMLDGIPVASYTFRQNYYFMLGDNRHNSEDSRYWGFLPEEGIVGKAVLVLFNYRNGNFKWDRLLKVQI